MLKFGRRASVLCTAWDKFLVKAKRTQLSTAPTKSNIIIEKLPESRSKEVLDHVTAVFLRDEPLSKRFPPCTTGKRKRDFHKYAIEFLDSGLSVMATDGPGGPVVGACLNKVLPREAVMGQCPPEPDPSDDPLLPSVIHMLTTIHQQLDLFSLFGLDEILDVGLLSVDPKYTGKGIAKQLVVRSLELGACSGLKAARINCSGKGATRSSLSAGIAKQLVIRSLELGACSGLKAAKTDCSGKGSTRSSLSAGMAIVFQLPYIKYTHSGRVVVRSIGDGNNEMTVLAAWLQREKPHVLPVNFEAPCQ